MIEQFVKREISSLEHAPVDWRPFGKHDRLGLSPTVLSVRASPQMMLRSRMYLTAFDIRLALLKSEFTALENIKKPLAACHDIIFQNIYPIERGHGQDGIPLVIQLTLP